VLIVNAAGVNVFGVLAVDFSAVVVVKDNLSQHLPTIATTITSNVELTSSTSSSSLTATTAKPLTISEKKRLEFCSSYSEYEMLCRGDYIIVIMYTFVMCYGMCICVFVSMYLDTDPAEFDVETKPVS